MSLIKKACALIMLLPLAGCWDNCHSCKKDEAVKVEQPQKVQEMPCQKDQACHDHDKNAAAHHHDAKHEHAEHKDHDHKHAHHNCHHDHKVNHDKMADDLEK